MRQLTTQPWREAKDIVIAIGCGFVAVIIGVGGVVVMTRKLVEDDDDENQNKIQQQQEEDPENKQ